eukprot:375847-Rhodomonas_salina.2
MIPLQQYWSWARTRGGIHVDDALHAVLWLHAVRAEQEPLCDPERHQPRHHPSPHTNFSICTSGPACVLYQPCVSIRKLDLKV